MDIENKKWYRASEVLSTLNLQRNSLYKIPKIYKSKQKILTNGGLQICNIITEDGKKLLEQTSRKNNMLFKYSKEHMALYLLRQIVDNPETFNYYFDNGFIIPGGDFIRTADKREAGWYWELNMHNYIHAE